MVHCRRWLTICGRRNHSPVAGLAQHPSFEQAEAIHPTRLPIAEWRRLERRVATQYS